MSYSTKYSGEMKFKNKLSDDELIYLNKILGEDIREIDPEFAKSCYWYF